MVSAETQSISSHESQEVRSKRKHRTHAGEPVRVRAARLLDIFIFIILLSVIALVAVPYGTVEPLWESAYQCIIFALVALWIIEGMLAGGEWQIKGWWLIAPLLLLVAYAFVQTAPMWSAGGEVAGVKGATLRTISVDPYSTRLAAWKMLTLTLTGALLLRYTSNHRRLRALVFVIIGVGIVSALFGLVRQTTHQNTPGFILPLLRPGVGYGQFINRNHFAYLMEMALGLALGFVFVKGEQRNRALLFLGLTLPLWTALVLSNSRGGILSMFCQLLFIFLLSRSTRPESELPEWRAGWLGWVTRIANSRLIRALLAVCLLLAIVIGVLVVGGDPLAKRLESMQTEASIAETGVEVEGSRRVKIWRATWEIIKEHPVTGIGFGGFWIAIDRYYAPLGRTRPYQAHNDYLELLASGGIIGVALAAWFLFQFLKRVRLSLYSKDSFRRAACCGALTGLFGIAVHSVVDFGLQITANAVMCVALAVIAAVDDRVESPSKKRSSTMSRAQDDSAGGAFTGRRRHSPKS
ncbi:MAG: O-antigen ligase family protein [Pyrinomonadaceae bacterium]|nr:O-antigen ligase family protein [Pyrinomonadaceae bacterium]